MQQALADALKRNESLAGELRVTRVERDLLKEQLNKFKRQLFAASSEVISLQKDMFFNEAESLLRPVARPHEKFSEFFKSMCIFTIEFGDLAAVWMVISWQRYVLASGIADTGVARTPD